jgi:cellulose synthase/poly-beta-1,6-N-acetylglucosamine synthase-like glycosyltransferase
MNAILIACMWLIAVIPTSILLVFTVEVWLGFAKTRALDLKGKMPKTCILIPAHNEQTIIKQTLERLAPLLSGTTTALIVADNCTDNTAALVREQGFFVIERTNAELRGKGFALAFGRDYLRADPPECVIVLDADCYTNNDAITDLARRSCSARSAVQARYVFEPVQATSLKVQISNFALWIKNVVRQRGSARIGGGAILTGTGMAFPWSLFERMPLATGSIVEDLSLTVDLALSGEAPLFLEQAMVLSPPASEQATLGQRSRWEHGFLSVAASQGLPLLRQGLITGNRKAALLGLHLLVPPLAFLIMLCSLIAAVLAGAALLTDNWLPFALLTSALAIALLGVFINWAKEGHVWLKPGALLLLPLYIVWKLPVYGRFIAGKRAGWNKTDRE